MENIVLSLVKKLFIRKIVVNEINWKEGAHTEEFLYSMFMPYSGALIDKKNTFFGPSAFLPEKINKIIEQSRYIFTIRSKRATTISHGGWDNYYHWYIDSIPRLYALQEINQGQRIELFISKKLAAVEKKLLLALLPSNVVLRQVSRFARVKADAAIFLPFLSHSCSGALPKGYLAFYREKVFATFNITETKKGTKVFISRKFASKRKFTNQDEVDNVAISKGFECVYLEHLSLPQQISCFYHADIIVGTHGAGLTNLIYSSKCTVVEIFHSDPTGLNHYKDLALSLSLDYRPVVLQATGKDAIIHLEIEQVNQILDMAC